MQNFGEYRRIIDRLRTKQRCLWLNTHLVPDRRPNLTTLAGITDAGERLKRNEPLLATLFDELNVTDGRIESPLTKAEDLIASSPITGTGAWFIKRDDLLPVAGSIKARGGFHEVLAYAEKLALNHGIIGPVSDRRLLATASARKFFSKYKILVGSTGNLGLAIGTLAAALGFKSEVHMSADAKQWKKDRLSGSGVNVVEHQGDYSAAVAAARSLIRASDYFIDDEASSFLFYGYATAALELKKQLDEVDRKVDSRTPLFVYLPCGVGGAPGGITAGLKAFFGENVHCFFAEPVASPSMLLQLCTGGTESVSVADFGLNNITEADGLAVGRASLFAARHIQEMVAGIFTVSDDELYENMAILEKYSGILLEPSAAAGIRGPVWFNETKEGRGYLQKHHIIPDHVTHIIWATGGSLVPGHQRMKYKNIADIKLKNLARNSSVPAE
ncbi:serine dehydratase [Gluconobacter thailandicus]|nr:serine dehydratase [Gluconobacter thailandicus]